MTQPVAVVGAGLAGLHAAWRLHSSGHDVVVLEARDRVGGRTWSHRLPDGTVVERGGEFIAPGDRVLRGLCAELGLELVPHGFPFDRRPTPDTPAPTEAEVSAAIAAAAARVAAADDDLPAADALAPGPVARRLETSLTVPLARVSARRMFAGGEDHGYDPADRVRGGNQGVALELARRLGDRVRLSTPVLGVHGDTVRCAGGEEVRAAAVVLAVPLPLLLQLDLDPGLPATVVRAAGHSLFGDAAKLHVPLAAAPEPGRMASPSALWWCWTSRGSRALSCFAGGTGAVAALDAAGALALRPGVEPAGDPLFTHWGEQAWTRGSYTTPAIGYDDADDAAWAQRFGHVVLAGEHTAGPGAGSMNGAAASGARAAETVGAWLSS
jgi:monoamine oxidase